MNRRAIVTSTPNVTIPSLVFTIPAAFQRPTSMESKSYSPIGQAPSLLLSDPSPLSNKSRKSPNRIVKSCKTKPFAFIAMKKLAIALLQEMEYTKTSEW